MTYICLGRKVSKVEKFRFLQTCHSYSESTTVSFKVSFQFLVLVVSRTLVVLVYLKPNFVRMIIVLHKHKIAHGKRDLFTHICCRKALGQLQYHLNVFQFFRKQLDIQMILQLSGCLSATNIYVNTTSFPHTILCLCNTTIIPTRYVFKFKDLSINLQTIHIHVDSL